MAAFALIGPAIKMLASQGVKKAAMGASKGIAKDKAKSFVTGKGRKKKKTKSGGRGSALTTTGDEEGSEGGGAIVPTTPMVGGYKVETLPDKPDEVGKPSKVSYESINNQLDSIIGLTNALKKTSTVKLKNAENRRKAERKASEKAKKRQRESLLERGAGKALGMAGNLYGKATQGFDPLKFFTMIFLGSLFNWVTTHGSKIIGFLKVGLALFNNAGKILKSGFKLLGKTFKAAFKLVGKLASPLSKLSKSVGGALKSVGKKLGSVFGKVGKSLKNFALGIINKLKSLGKALNPLKALRSLSGAEKKSLKANKGLSKITNAAGGAASNVGTASRATGKMSNATRALRLKHGPEAAERYKNLVDKGMDPAKASRKVNKAIKAGKIVSKPAAKASSKVAQAAGKKGVLSVAKGSLKFLKRIPIVGGLISLVVSLLSGDPVTQALFKAGGAVLGGFLGSFIPIPVVGTLIGEILGEYIGDLFYVLTKGDEGGAQAVGNKIKEDIGGLLSAGKAAMDWVGKGFGRLFEGIPKIIVPFVGKFPNPVWMANPFNLMEKLGIFHKAFFTNNPMEKGEETTDGENKSEETPTPVSAETQQTLKTALPSGINTNMSIGSQLKKNFGYKTGQEVKFQYGGAEYVAKKTNQGWQFFDQKGLFGNYRMVDTKGKNQQMVAAFIKSADKTPDTTETPTSTVQPQSPLIGTSGISGSKTSGTPSLGSTDVQANIKAILKAAKEMNYTGDIPALLAIAKGESGIKGIPEQPITSADRASQIWSISREEAQQLLDSGGWRALYNDVYGWSGNSLGNRTGTNDGSDFIGRGFIQITGRHNYKDIGDRIGVDFMSNPDALLDKDIAAKATIAFMQRGGSPKDMESALRAVGGIKEGWPKKRRFYEDFKQLESEGKLKTDTNNNQPQQSVDGVTYDAATGLPTSGNVTSQDQSGSVQPRTSTPDNSDISSTPAPAQVSPSTSSQTQMSNGINGISQQLSYEESGNTVVMMQGSGGHQMPMGGGGKGTPVIMGSGDVVNSYYKSQLMGFLYKQG